MRRVSILVCLWLILSGAGPVGAGEAELSPEMKAWQPVLGTWAGTTETRETPDGPWIESPIAWDVRGMGGHVEIDWRLGPEGRDGYAKELVGWDPSKKCFSSKHLDSRGTHVDVTSMGWEGTTLHVNYTRSTADGITSARVTWTYSEDFATTAAHGEFFSGGRWWTSWKVNAAKIDEAHRSSDSEVVAPPGR